MPTRALLVAQAATALAGVLLVSNPHTTPSRPAAPLVAAPVAVAVRVVAVSAHRPPVRRVLPRRVAVGPTTPRPRRTVHRTTTTRPVVVRSMTTTTTPDPQQSMQAAVLRLPGYQPGSTTWLLSPAYGSWGTADWYHDTVYVAPTVPTSRMYDVVAHEWSHILSVRPYGGDVDAAVAAMDSWFGGSGLTGAERAADCMARQLGARWTEYTSCQQSHWQDGARMLLSGRQLSSG